LDSDHSPQHHFSQLLSIPSYTSFIFECCRRLSTQYSYRRE